MLHRAIMATAKRVQPGALATPAELGAVSVPVCRLSGLRATPSCAQLSEWFARGTEPQGVDDWEREGRVALPAEYAEWSRQGLAPVMVSAPLIASRTMHQLAHPEPAIDLATHTRAAQLRIVSPLDGDRYAIPTGVEARYATISLRAAGRSASRVRWSVDGRLYENARWPLVAGAHVVRAMADDGEVAEARIVVER